METRKIKVDFKSENKFIDNKNILNSCYFEMIDF